MLRSATRKSLGLITDFAYSAKYPTRTVEHAFSWLILVWSYSVLANTGMLTARVPGNVYGPMLDIMPAQMWGWVGVVTGVARLVALFLNGNWRPTPELRLIGAAWGLMFWAMLSYCYYVAIDLNGGPDFPMRRAFFVLIFFEAYACYRCGQDMGLRQKINHKSVPSGLMGAGYG